MGHPPLWDHQVDGINWTDDRHRSYLHLTMGAGKSRILVSAADRRLARSVLIVCPKSVVSDVWPGEFAKWSDRPWHVIPWTEFKGTAAAKVKRVRREIDARLYDRKPFALVVNYDALRSADVLRLLRERTWDIVVFDEAHKLKSPRGKTSKAAASVTRKNAKRVIGMSGTPMPHSPMDIFAQLRAIAPDVFGGSFIRFRARYAEMGGYKNKNVVGFRNQEEMTEKIAAVMFSPPDDAVKLNLPESRDEIRHVDLTPKARKLYDALRDDVVASVEGGVITYQNGLVKLLRMQQLCSGLAVADVAGEAEDLASLSDEELAEFLESDVEREELEVCKAKLEALVDILGATDEPVVVFGQFRRDMDVVTKACYALDELNCELSGQRSELASWKRGDRRVLAVQIASGADGINLTRARICVYLSTGFNLGSYLQSRARVHRPGQKRAVVYYHIHARSTVDSMVWRVLQKREDLVRGVLAQIKSGAVVAP